MVEGGIFLAKQYRAMEEAWQRGDFFWAGSGNVLFTYLQKKCPFDKLRERVFFVLAKKVSLRQAQGTGVGDFFLLAKQYRAMEGGFVHAESRSDSAILLKIHGGIFRRRPTRDWRGGGSRSVGMEGVGAPGTPESP